MKPVNKTQGKAMLPTHTIRNTPLPGNFSISRGCLRWVGVTLLFWLICVGCGDVDFGEDIAQSGSCQFEADCPLGMDCVFNQCVSKEEEPLPPLGNNDIPPDDQEPDGDDNDQAKDPGTGETHWIVVELAAQQFLAPDAAEALSGYLFEDLQARITTPTTLGLQAHFLALVAVDAFTLEGLAPQDATEALKTLINTLQTHQQDPVLSQRGLLQSVLQHNGGAWQPSADAQRIEWTQNASLGLSLAAAAGALQSILEEPPPNDVRALIDDIDTILDRQAPGFEHLLDCQTDENLPQSCAVRVGWDAQTDAFLQDPITHHRIYGSGVRAGMAFAILRHGLPVETMDSLTLHMRTVQDTPTLVSPHGGAFEMLGPDVDLPTIGTHNRGHLERFAQTLLAHATDNNQLGLLSASYRTPRQRVQNVGLKALALQQDPPPDQSLVSFYALGAARAVLPNTTDTFMTVLLLEGWFEAFSGDGGLLEGIDGDMMPIEVRSPSHNLQLIRGLSVNGEHHTAAYLRRRQLDLEAFYPAATLINATSLLPTEPQAITTVGIQATIDPQGALEGMLSKDIDPNGASVTVQMQTLDAAGGTLAITLESSAPLPPGRLLFHRTDGEPALVIHFERWPAVTADGVQWTAALPEFVGLQGLGAWSMTFDTPPDEDIAWRMIALQAR